MLTGSKADILAGLQTDILRLQGFKPADSAALDLGLGQIIDSFPNSVFPLGAIHEFISERKEQAAVTTGFISGLLSVLMGNNGAAVWISADRKLFPPALRSFGIQPDRFIFIDLKKEKNVAWAMDEALKCGALSAVVGEMSELNFAQSRRLQLAVEKSKVTGFVLHHTKSINTTACVSRWKISSLPSLTGGLPGIGYPKWKVELLRIRNGKPGSWEVYWRNGKFHIDEQSTSILQWPEKQAG